MGKEETIFRAGPADSSTLAALAGQLWLRADPAALEAEFAELTERGDAACFLCCAEGRAVGFAQSSLRHDYVEGTASSPVGYLEGIFVLPEYRNRGLAAALLARCESWAREQGCAEFASDCELGNDGSLAFHLALGFEEANRIICFRKALRRGGG